MLICEAVEPDGKSCRACEQYKRLDEYCKGTGRYGLQALCIPCHYASSRQRRKDNPDKVRIANRKAKLKALCGISPETWQDAWDAQGGLCALCSSPLRRGAGGVATDHDHGTDKFRALLCCCCNTAIGKLRDDPALMRKAADYVEAHRAA